VSATGISGTSAPAVASEMSAVPALITPESQYVGCQSVHTSITCVVPQATMNAPNMMNRNGNGTSLRLRTK
jgi:hypothetical protein